MPNWFYRVLDDSPNIELKDCLNPEKLLTTLSDSDVSFYLAVNSIFGTHMVGSSAGNLVCYGEDCFERPITNYFNDITKGEFFKVLTTLNGAVNKKSTANIVKDFHDFNDYLIDDNLKSRENLSLTYEIKNLDENTICLIPFYKESSLVKEPIEDFLIEHVLKMLNQRESLDKLALTNLFRKFLNKL
jgi:hypothetical protein